MSNVDKAVEVIAQVMEPAQEQAAKILQEHGLTPAPVENIKESYRHIAQALHDAGLLMPGPDQFTYVLQELTPTGWEDVATYSHEHRGKAFSDVMQYQPVSHQKARVMRRFEEVAQP